MSDLQNEHPQFNDRMEYEIRKDIHVYISNPTEATLQKVIHRLRISKYLDRKNFKNLVYSILEPHIEEEHKRIINKFFSEKETLPQKKIKLSSWAQSKIKKKYKSKSPEEIARKSKKLKKELIEKVNNYYMKYEKLEKTNRQRSEEAMSNKKASTPKNLNYYSSENESDILHRK